MLNSIRVVVLGIFMLVLTGCGSCGLEAKMCSFQCDGKICETKCAAEEKMCEAKAAVDEKLK